MIDNVNHFSYTYHQPYSLRSIISTLNKRKVVIGLILFCVVATVTVGSFIMTPIYHASMKILIEPESVSEKALLFRLYMPSKYENIDWIKTEIDIMTSRPVAESVVRELQLHEIGKKRNNKSKISPREQFEAVVEATQKKIIVENEKTSNVLKISYESEDPRLASAVVKKVLEVYTDYRSKIFSQSKSYNFFEDQLKVTDEKLRELESRQANYKQREDIISPGRQIDILLTKLSDFEKSLTAVRTQRIGKEAKLSVLHENLKNNNNNLSIPTTEVSDNPSRERYIADLKSQLLEMQIERDKLLQRFKPTYTRIIELNRNIETTKAIITSENQQIVHQEETAIKALIAEEKSLEEAIRKINREIKDFAQKDFQMTQLSRGIDDNREVYSMLLKQREEARISLSKLTSGVLFRVISPAVVPNKPARPNKVLNIAIALVLGLVAGVGTAFFLEYNDSSIKSAEDVESLIGLRALGSVREVKYLNVDKNDGKVQLVRKIFS